MKIWVDIAMPPQVLFLKPIMAEMVKRDHTLVVTTRHSTETVALADQVGLSHIIVGRHGGRSTTGKTTAIGARAWQLMNLFRGQRFDLAVSHSSYSQALVAGLCRIPFVALTDYAGHPGMRLVSAFARKIMVPHIFASEELYRRGARASQIDFYGGLKEDVYLSGFVPDPDFLPKLGISRETVLVLARPASEVAAYHQFENKFFDEVLGYITRHENVLVIVLPRTPEQRQRFAELKLANLLMPPDVLDGPNLVYHADLVVGAGGTMNREAVALGTPVYTMFQGMLGSVDAYLIQTGRMVRVASSGDFQRIKLQKKDRGLFAPEVNRGCLIDEIVDKIFSVS